MPACCPWMLAPGGCSQHPATEILGKILPWGRTDEKGRPVQLGLWRLHPVKLLELSERQEGLEHARKKLKVTAHDEGFGEV